MSSWGLAHDKKPARGRLSLLLEAFLLGDDILLTSPHTVEHETSILMRHQKIVDVHQ
jgi:hypothetical protein